MSYHIAIQNTVASDIPVTEKIEQWATCVLNNRIDSAEICIRIVNELESKELNQTYRNKPYPTNVLSFPYEPLSGIKVDVPYLGDLVLCSSVIEREAKQQHKTTEAHWAHMIVHGLLHLLGYDHTEEVAALEMEGIEIKILKCLGYDNPYGDDNL